ncbi:MAG: hemerythrin domain-containing protein [Myxococcales bacterium]|nr:hemerythrin domain-containing protein [Myxococcales bacterium]MDH5307527.1 hemerythrin domain-containing protein [Myxococcales bacterium]MDH5566205.1 hemerythrin domain-containing protein [Myxococcales bacterium]
MQPGEIRKRVLRDHALLRTGVAEVESLARDVLGGARGLDARLRSRGDALLASLERHMSWEDAHLAPVLRAADLSGRSREALLREDHSEQRQVLRYVSEKLRDTTRPAAVLARNLLDLTTMLREDMSYEERTFVDAKALRDDGIGAPA